MFNSPAPRATPRRGPSRPRDSLSVSRATPSIFSEPENRHPATPSIRSSRLAISRGIPSPTSSAGETTRTVREVDGYERTLWHRDERFCVASAGGLPKEVQSLLKRSDLVVNPVWGHLDPISGFAFVTTPLNCVAWNYQKRSHSSPTCYTFPAPPSYSHSTQVPVLASLYTGNTGEPGMILVGPSGEVRFWENMSLALANVDHYHILDLTLGDNDFAERIWSADGHNLIITTTTSLAFRLTISIHAGRVVPSITPLTRSGGMFGRSTNNIFPRHEDKGGVTAVAANRDGVYILAGKTVQKWYLSPDSLRFVQDYDLQDIVGNALFDDNRSNGKSTIELKDLVPCGQHEVATLVSYTENQSTSYSISHSFAIVIFTINQQTNSLDIMKMLPVSYTSHADPRALDVPRLLIPASSPTAFIRFADTVVLVSLSPDDEYEDVVSLKDTGRNAFIGTGCNVTSITSRTTQSPALMLMPAIGGLMSVEVLEPSTKPATTSMNPSTAALKSKMEQAVFYGDRSDNPLSFDLPPGFQGDAAEAAEAVSKEILASSSPYMPALFELKPLLMDRLARMKELIAFVRGNGLLSMLSQTTRRKLSRDAEKAKGAVELWEHQNKIMDHLHTRSPQSLLADSIAVYMDSIGLSGDEDVVRSFFRSQAANLDKLLEVVFATFRAAVASLDERGDGAGWLLEMNRIFLTVFRAASTYREDESSTYEIDRSHPPVEFWTARETLIDALEFLYSSTEQTVQDRTRTLGSVIDEIASDTQNPEIKHQRHVQTQLKNQMALLAAVLCTNMEDKIRTQSQRELNGGADPSDGLTLKSRWDTMRPRIIRPLVGIDRVEEAYELAEHHSDFATLVFLCHDPVAGKGPGKVQTYIERFGEEYAFVLYQWYIDQGHLHELMTQDGVYGGLLTKFFNTNEYPQLAWMHHIACKRYGEAAKALLIVNGTAAELGQKHLVSSIGKLAAVAEIKVRGNDGKRKNALHDLDDELDLINVQNVVRESLSSAVPRGQSPLQAYIGKNATGLSGRPALLQLLQDQVQALLDGQALDLEGLVDILTLKDNHGDAVGDPAIALERLVKDSTLPEGRKAVALISIWRRVFIRDDWSVIANTKGRSEEAQRGILRNTLAYHTLKYTNENSIIPPPYIVSPYNASVAPLPAELAARFPEWPAGDIQALLADHEDEVNVLNGYMADAGLERMIREVSGLVKRDMSLEEDGDVNM